MENDRLRGLDYEVQLIPSPILNKTAIDKKLWLSLCVVCYKFKLKL